jgi:hypothetical protein
MEMIDAYGNNFCKEINGKRIAHLVPPFFLSISIFFFFSII